MRKGLFISIIIILIAVGSVFYFHSSETKEEGGSKLGNINNMEQKTLEGKKIAQIIAFRDFRDEEYFIPHNIFLSAGAEIKTFSTSEGVAIGVNGGEAKVDGLIDNLDVSDFDAVVFSGGPGCLKYLDNETSYEIAKETLKQGKILGAICISPVILAKAGVLEGKRATVWHSIMDKSPVKILKENGAEFIDEKVVRDGNIITGNGPQAAKEFAEEIVKILTEK